MKFDFILKFIWNWFEELLDKIMENSLQNILYLFVSVAIMFTFAKHFYEHFSIFTLVGYTFLCLKGITRVIDKPERTVVWAVGVVIGSTAFKVLTEQFIPSISFKSIASVISMLVILYVVFEFYRKSKELKSA